MPVPPPPPPPPPGPPPPPPPSAALPQCPLEPPKLQTGGGGGGGGGGRNALLADIQRGTKLRKVTQVNDCSAPAVEKSKPNTGDASGNVAASQGPSGGMAPVGPSLSGLFAGGFPTLRPIGQRDLAVKTSVCRSSSSASLKPLWNPPMSDTPSEPHKTTDIHTSLHRPLAPSSSAPPSPSHSSRHPPPFPASSPPTPPPAPPSAPPPPPPPQAFQDRPANRPPPLPSCPPPPPPTQVTKPTWLPIQHSYHTSVSQPSTPPPPPPPPPAMFQTPSPVSGDRSSGCFYPPPPTSAVYSEPSRFPILRDSPLGPPPPPPPPLPASFTPTCPSNLPPPPPKLAPVPSPAMRSLPPSYPCNAPTRRPPAVPRSAGMGRLAPPPAPPARSPNTELSTRIPPPPPPLPPSSLRNGHLHSLADDFESKFQFHPIEDLPPPDEFKPFPRIYPSKENRVNPKPPGIRTHLR